MVNNAIKQCLLMCFCASILLFAGCQDKDYYDPDRDTTNVGDDPSNLDFSTAQNVKFNLNYNAPDGFVSVFDVYSEYPLNADGMLRSDVTAIAGGINVAGVSEVSRVIPSYVTDLYLYSPNVFVPLLAHAKIANGVASFEEVEISDAVASRSSVATRAGNAGSDFWKKKAIKYLKTKDDFYQETADGHMKYDLIHPDMTGSVPTELKTLIGNAFKEGKIPDSKFIKDANLQIINPGPDGKGAKLYISILASNASWKNTLSYFVYKGDKTDLSQLTSEEIAKLEFINVFPLARLNTYGKEEDRMGLSPNTYIQLLYKNESGEFVEEFPKGAIVGWRLGGGAFNEKTFEESLNTWGEGPLSVSAWNAEKTNPKHGPTAHPTNQTIYFSIKDSEGTEYNCFGFEDRRTDSDEDYNDLIFHVYTDPADALVPPPGVDDEDITKSETLKGVLAFEDNWPAQKDYDLNDVVVKYNSTVNYLYRVGKDKDGNIVKSTKPMVTKIEDVFSFIHTGATYNNAFSYKVNVAPSKVKSLTIDGEKYELIPDGDGFIVDLCPNVKDVITPMEYGVTPKVYNVVMEFVDDAVSEDEFSALAAPYNPFISPRETPGAEVHLPMYAPTTRADMSLFGTEDDRSDKVNLWYVSGVKNKYPFAIHLARANDDFVVPQEQEKIYVTYPEYTEWVESDMAKKQDWYLHPAQ